MSSACAPYCNVSLKQLIILTGLRQIGPRRGVVLSKSILFGTDASKVQQQATSQSSLVSNGIENFNIYFRQQQKKLPLPK